MAKIVVKETVSKEREIDISLDVLIDLVDELPVEDKKRLVRVVSASLKKDETVKFIPFEEDAVESILADFEKTGLYEGGFLDDLGRGLRKSTLYNK